jgi:hypothetical protein
MPNKPPINKWDMCKKIDLKESMENFTCVWLKIHQRVWEGESKSKFERCRACNAQTIFDVIGTEAKGVKALTTHANSLRTKLCHNQCKEDTTRAQSRRDRVANKPSPKRKLT